VDQQNVIAKESDRQHPRLNASQQAAALGCAKNGAPADIFIITSA
jgi:hypothetical protein